MNRKTAKVLGYDVDLMTFNDALAFVENNLSNSKGLHIITINPEIIEMANKDTEFAKIINNADLVIPDGVGIKLALKFKGIKQEQIPGIDFAKKLLYSCKNKRTALIGAKEEVIKKAEESLRKEIPELNICYAANGYFSKEEENNIIDKLANSAPDLVLVALGAPKQDIFINKCLKKMPNTIFIGVGGSFDVWAGVVERAPEIFRAIGCEWLFRTIKQPQRLKRIYKTLPIFLFKAIIESKR